MTRGLWLLVALIVPGGLILAGVAYLRQRRASAPLSAAWFAEQARADQRRGVDGVTIRFPIDKVRNSQGWRTRHEEQERRRTQTTVA